MIKSDPQALGIIHFEFLMEYQIANVIPNYRDQ